MTSVVNPDPNAERWLAVDTERMTGIVPHMAENGSMGVESAVVRINGQVVTCPFFDPGDGQYGGVFVGQSVAYYAPGEVTYSAAIVMRLEEGPDESVFADLHAFGVGEVVNVPHQLYREPRGPCWAHTVEPFHNTGRIAAELALGVGGAAYEEAKKPAPDVTTLQLVEGE